MSHHSPFGSPSPGSSRRTSKHITTEGLTIANEQSSQHSSSMDESARRGFTAPIPDTGDPATLPLTLSASTVLTVLPKSSRQALAEIEELDNRKVTVRFLPMPSAPILQSKVFKVSASQKFETIVRFLRKKLGCKDTDSVFCYVNSVFAPGLDEGIGGLWRCFKSDDQLIISYSMTPAFG
ncbi:Ubiquitin-like protein [Arthroderma sp. PD_2]|nr:Ubiquitin-like protein [Arthroderma sp. PD_2]